MTDRPVANAISGSPLAYPPYCLCPTIGIYRAPTGSSGAKMRYAPTEGFSVYPACDCNTRTGGERTGQDLIPQSQSSLASFLWEAVPSGFACVVNAPCGRPFPRPEDGLCTQCRTSHLLRPVQFGYPVPGGTSPKPNSSSLVRTRPMFMAVPSPRRKRPPEGEPQLRGSTGLVRWPDFGAVH